MNLRSEVRQLRAYCAHLPPPPDPDRLDGIERARSGMEPFVSWTKADYLWGWHHRTLCRYLDALVEGSIRRLMVFMPPRSGKSELVSRRLPAYFLGKHPDDEVIACSVTADLASRMNLDVQRVMDSPRYAELFPGTRLPGGRSATRWGQARGKRTDSFFEVAGRRGTYRSAGVGGTIVGMGFRLGVIDDPFADAEEAQSATIRDKVWDWYCSTFLTRQGPDARILITHTRWHHDDLAGRLLREMKAGGDQWAVLNLPAVSEDSRDPADERTEAGQPLWPERFPLPWLEGMKRAVGTRWWNAMYQQRPTPEGGNLFKRSWFGQYRDGGDYWLLAGRRDPVHKAGCTVFAAVDPAASEKHAADYTAVVVGALTPQNDLLLLEAVRDRLTPDQIPGFLRDVCRRWDCQFLVAEDSGFQVAVVAAARRLSEMPPIREVSHHGRGKVVRATPAIIKAEAGQVFVPTPTPEWVGPFFEELEQFRGEDETNDQADAFAYLVLQCPRLGAGGGWVDQDDVAGRVDVRGRASGQGLWGRYGAAADRGR